MSKALQLSVVDLSSEDRLSTANSIRQECLDLGFFYLVNHGVEEELLKNVFEQSKKFFSLPVEEKIKFAFKNYRGDSKESFDIGSLAEDQLNQWPSEGKEFQKICRLGEAQWRLTNTIKSCWTKIVSSVALALNLDEDFFQKLGALTEPMIYLRLLHYPGNVDSSREEVYGVSAHSDFGTISLLLTDGVPGLQVCREKSKQPQVWEDVPSISGAFIVNIGDMMERWTNCLFRSTLHRVLTPAQERYSVAFFVIPNKDCMVECLESCCSESSPPRFPPIRSLDYMKERLKLI